LSIGGRRSSGVTAVDATASKTSSTGATQHLRELVKRMDTRAGPTVRRNHAGVELLRRRVRPLRWRWLEGSREKTESRGRRRSSRGRRTLARRKLRSAGELVVAGDRRRPQRKGARRIPCGGGSPLQLWPPDDVVELVAPPGHDSDPRGRRRARGRRSGGDGGARAAEEEKGKRPGGRGRMDGEVQGEWMRGILSPQRRWPSVGDALSAPRRRSARRPEARRHGDGERES
jgi:hypothetical protein